eukprot:14320405-Ditylum_brightwellii.AAC.1
MSTIETTQNNNDNISKKRKHEDTNPNIIPPRNENIGDQDVKFESLFKSGKELLTWHHNSTI